VQSIQLNVVMSFMSKSVCVFLLRQNFAKFQPEKYEFNLHKGFSMETKMIQIWQILENKKVSKLPDFYDKFQ
jgi:hypothetical protein